MSNAISTTQTVPSQIQTTSQPAPYQPSVIEIGSIQALLGVAAVLLGVGIAWGTLKTSVKHIGKTLDEIKPDLKEVREKFRVVESRVETLWKDGYAPAHSPRQLNDIGNKILKESGIEEVVNQKKNDLLKIIIEKDTKNAYDAERAIMEVMSKLPEHFPDVVEKLKLGAFQVGSDLDALLFVGGIYLRNLIFKDLGYDLIDLDKQKKS